MHQKIMATVTAAALVAIGGCKNQGAAPGEAINGTWQLDVSSVQFDANPDVYLLQDGTFACKSCTPAYSVVADGAYHPVKMPYFDSDAIKIVDDHTIIESTKKGNKPVRVSTTTVWADDKTASTEFTDTSRPGLPVKGVITETRVGPSPAGAHLISGQWKPSKLLNFNNGTFTSRVSGGTFQWSSPDGTSYEAKIGDGDTALKGDIAGTRVSVAKVGDTSYQITFRRDGKVVEINTMTVAAGGKLNGVNENKEDGSITRWVAYQHIMP